MAGELERALVEQRLGVDITDALDGVGERMDSEDFDWVVMAIRIQREVGGNLAEILHTVADTLREREYLRRQVQGAERRRAGCPATSSTGLAAADRSSTCCSSTRSTSRALHDGARATSCSRSPRSCCWPRRRSPCPSSRRWRSDMSARYFCCSVPAARLRWPDAGPLHHRRGHHRATRRRPVGGRHPGARHARPSVLKEELERPFAERVLGPLGDRLVGTGRKTGPRRHRAEAPVPPQHRRQPPGVGRQPDHRPQGARPGGLRSARRSSTSSGWAGRSTASSLATALVAAFGYVLPNILLYNAGRSARS